ncbi:hypothetical protein V8G54_005777 [Vigna mungo]|uniref:Uncharacterized protein n=1 Tax=Vigna mungo TaxID=3915 RepID=A0AAQ3NYV3_VIGMU
MTSLVEQEGDASEETFTLELPAPPGWKKKENILEAACYTRLALLSWLEQSLNAPEEFVTAVIQPVAAKIMAFCGLSSCSSTLISGWPPSPPSTCHLSHSTPTFVFCHLSWEIRVAIWLS